MPLDEVGGPERAFIRESHLQLSMVRSVILLQNVRHSRPLEVSHMEVNLAFF